METDVTVAHSDVEEVIALIQEYLFQGGDGRDGDALERVLSALSYADRIVILREGVVASGS